MKHILCCRNAQQVSRIMQRSERNTFLNIINHRLIDNGRFLKMFAAMHNAMTNRTNFFIQAVPLQSVQHSFNRPCVVRVCRQIFDFFFALIFECNECVRQIQLFAQAREQHFASLAINNCPLHRRRAAI